MITFTSFGQVDTVYTIENCTEKLNVLKNTHNKSCIKYKGQKKMKRVLKEMTHDSFFIREFLKMNTEIGSISTNGFIFDLNKNMNECDFNDIITNKFYKSSKLFIKPDKFQKFSTQSKILIQYIYHFVRGIIEVYIYELKNNSDLHLIETRELKVRPIINQNFFSK